MLNKLKKFILGRIRNRPAPKVIFEKSNAYGAVKIIESQITGKRSRILFLNGIRQCGTDMPIAGIAKIIDNFGRSSLRVARVGNACGFALAKIATNPKIFRIDAIEINPVMLKAMEFFEEWTGPLSKNPKIRFITADAFDYFLGVGEKYDLIDIWVRASDVFYSKPLYEKPFFESIRKCLSRDGILSLWIANVSAPEFTEEIRLKLLSSFRYVNLYEPKEKYLLASNRPLEERLL